MYFIFLCFHLATTRSELNAAFSETLYHKWSINDEGAARADFSLHTFGKIGFLKGLGEYLEILVSLIQWIEQWLPWNYAFSSLS